MATLTQGCISQIYRNNTVKQPVVQLIDLKMVSSSDSSAPRSAKCARAPPSAELPAQPQPAPLPPPRRCKLSDGEQFGSGVMSSDLAQQVMSEKIKLNSIVKITQYACNALNASRCAGGALTSD